MIYLPPEGEPTKADYLPAQWINPASIGAVEEAREYMILFLPGVRLCLPKGSRQAEIMRKWLDDRREP